MVVVNLSAALICFLGSCYPALIGANTPTGTFHLEQRTTQHIGYGGDVLLFKEGENGIFAIHRIINFNPDQKRHSRIRSPAPRDRVITDGCVNVLPEVYEQLVDCCSDETLVIMREHE